ncbi:MAG: hypothetical protein KC656_04165 [Myxococcales bacterium]|nr:hypothetical protein [Myxococcales bacterium]
MRTILVLGVLTGCESLPPTHSPLEPVKPPAPAAAPAPVVAAPAPAPAPDPFEEPEDPEPEAPEVDFSKLTPAQRMAVLNGDAPPVDPEAPPVPEPEPEPSPDTPVASPVAPATPVYAWDPATAPPATWGVRLLSTVNSTLPPRAVIGLPDGTEEVVQPGSMLPDHDLVVMAVGRHVIEVAHVVPDGVQARIETRTIQALFPSD